MPQSGKGIGVPFDNCFVHLDAYNRPVLMFGAVRRCSSKGRPPPPDCISGFNTAQTPFAKGHIMALELGGCDESFNIVPQYEKWQGLPNGEWRKMEISLHDSPAVNFMVVKLSYPATGDTRGPSVAKFNGGDTLCAWNDGRIPVRFEIWALKTDPGGYFALGTPDKDAHGPAIAATLGATAFDFSILAMPEIDRDYWRTTRIRGFIEKKYLKYCEEYALEFASKVAMATKGHPVIIKTSKEKTKGKGLKKTSKGAVQLQGAIKKTMNQRQAAREVREAMPEIDKNGDWVNRIATAKMIAEEAKKEDAVMLGWTPMEIASLNSAEVRRMAFGND